MARPNVAIEPAKLKALMRLKPTLADTAAYFECSERTIDRFIKDNFNLTFVEFREQHMVHTRLSIVRKAISLAESGNNVMLIFCLKNLCGWKDKQPDEVDKTIVQTDININKADLLERINQVKEKK